MKRILLIVLCSAAVSLNGQQRPVPRPVAPNPNPALNPNPNVVISGNTNFGVVRGATNRFSTNRFGTQFGPGTTVAVDERGRALRFEGNQPEFRAAPGFTNNPALTNRFGASSTNIFPGPMTNAFGFTNAFGLTNFPPGITNAAGLNNFFATNTAAFRFTTNTFPATTPAPALPPSAPPGTVQTPPRIAPGAPPTVPPSVPTPPAPPAAARPPQQ